MTNDIKNREITVFDYIEGVKREAEAAQYLNISKQSLMRLRKAGKIGFFRIGSRGVRYGYQHLTDYLETVNQEGGQR